MSKRFFDILGVTAPPVTDDLLLPWRVGPTSGTIFVMAHAREIAFDAADCRVMEALADFAAMAVRQERIHKISIQAATESAAADMANTLAHKINNPLQSLTNQVFLAQTSLKDQTAQEFAESLAPDLKRLSSLTKKLLELPFEEIRKLLAKTAKKE